MARAFRSSTTVSVLPPLRGHPGLLTPPFGCARTEVGEFYQNHYDAYEHDTISGDKKMKDGGNRVITALVYLNEPEEGGETDLVNLGLKIYPATGKLLVFHDCCKTRRFVVAAPLSLSLYVSLRI